MRLAMHMVTAACAHLCLLSLVLQTGRHFGYFPTNLGAMILKPSDEAFYEYNL